jgi:hypothetical protein
VVGIANKNNKVVEGSTLPQVYAKLKANSTTEHNLYLVRRILWERVTGRGAKGML